MMNIIQIEEALKSFSQDQLVGELNQPSGNVPEFLVLTELGRRNRIKSDMDRQQAENQPTVAEEVVNAAGVPQGGIRDIARSLDAKSSIEQNTGVTKMQEGGKVEEPKNRFEMLMAYLRSLGADDEEIEQATGKSIAEMINFGGDYDTVKKSDGGVVKMNQGTVVYNGKTYFTDGTFVAERGESGRIVPVNDPEIVSAVTKQSPSAQTDVGGIESVSSTLEDFSPNLSFSNTVDPQVDRSALDPVLGIKPEMIAQPPDQNNPLPSIDKDTQKAVSEIAEPTGRQSLDGKMVSTVGPTADEIERAQKVLELNPDLTASDEELELLGSRLNFLNRDPEEDSDLFPVKSRRKNRDKNEVKKQVDSNLSGRNDPQRSNKNEFGLETEDIPFSEIPGLGEKPPFLPSGSGGMPDELMTPFNNTPKVTDPPKDPDKNTALSSLESEIANMLKENEKEKEQDKWLSLARAGLALMGSTNPTLGGAIGEAGMVGLESFQDARKSYRDDKITLLDAQRKLEQARATAAGKDKSGLTGTNLVSLLNNIRTQKSKAQESLVEALASDQITGAEKTPQELESIEMLKKQIAQLDVMEQTYASMIGGGSAGSTVNFDATK